MVGLNDGEDEDNLDVEEVAVGLKDEDEEEEDVDEEEEEEDDNDDNEDEDEDDDDDKADPSEPATPGGEAQYNQHAYYHGYHPAYHYVPVPMNYLPQPQQQSQAMSDFFSGNSQHSGYSDASVMADPAPDTRRNRGGVTEPFPEKLHRMLEATEREGLSDVVSFFSHGRAFSIHKPRRFVAEIMPRFFRQTRLTSFQRQLNLYGFRRISQGPDNGGYYHELFLKGRQGLCVNMKRTKVKGDNKQKRDPDAERKYSVSLSFPGDCHHTDLTLSNIVFSANFYAMRPVAAPDPASAAGAVGSASQQAYAFPPQGPYAMYPPVFVNQPYTAAQQTNAHVAAYPPPPPPTYYYSPYWGYPVPPQSPQGSPAQESQTSEIVSPQQITAAEKEELPTPS
jgi:hypothetical protein